MKKILLALLAAGSATGAMAQASLSQSVVQLGTQRSHGEVVAPSLGRVTTHRQVDPTIRRHAAKPTQTESRWYNAGYPTYQYFGITADDYYDTSRFAFIAMWQDSSVYYTGSTNGINWLSVGNVFHPQSPLFNDASLGLAYNNGAMTLDNTEDYTIDSIGIYGFYSRTDFSYDDTLIFHYVWEGPTDTFAYFSYGGSTFDDHGVDSFAVQLWYKDDYLVRPIEEQGYSFGGSNLRDTFVKVVLNDAVFADSATDGTHFIAAPINLAMTAGKKATVSITFSSGSGYTPGTELINYNYFAFGTHETDPESQGGTGYVQYVPGDLNMSSVVTSDTTNANVNTLFNFYVPSIAFTAPFIAELHEIEWKVSKESTGTRNVANNAFSASAYPNPATDFLSIPVSVKTNAAVSVVLNNAMGQQVAAQQLGNVAAGATATAKFNTSALASGVYFYTVTVGGETATKRVVIR